MWALGGAWLRLVALGLDEFFRHLNEIALRSRALNLLNDLASLEGEDGGRARWASKDSRASSSSPASK